MCTRSELPTAQIKVCLIGSGVRCALCVGVEKVSRVKGQPLSRVYGGTSYVVMWHVDLLVLVRNHAVHFLEDRSIYVAFKHQSLV